MAAVLDKSLEQIIAEKPKNNRRPRRARGASGALGTRSRYTSTIPAANGVAAKQAAAAAVIVGQAGAPSPQTSDKIIVSNLPLDVNEAQIKELFQTTVGPLREVNLHFDANGKSKGVAHVHFQKKGDGTKAYNQYNNRLIDGKRPMKIEIILDPARVAPPSLASRVAPAPAAKNARTAAAPMEGIESSVPSARGRRGARGKGRGGGRRKGEGRPNKSAADLDAEMEDYTQTPAAAAAA